MRRLLLLPPLARPLGTMATILRAHRRHKPRPERVPEKERAFVAALRRFRALEGHFAVPVEFVVPFDEDDALSPVTFDANVKQAARAEAWPVETRGLELGKRVRALGRARESRTRAAVLEAVDFPGVDWGAYIWTEQTLPALRAFRRVHGHLFSKPPFRVPSEGDEDANKWPRAAWGIGLGALSQQLRNKRANGQLLPEQLQELNDMGFVWSLAQWRWQWRLLPALKRFHLLFGHAQVPVQFSIPEGDPLWPEHFWGYKLGLQATRVVEHIRDLESPHDERAKQELAELGFYDTNGADKAFRDRVLPCLEIYATICRQDGGENCEVDIPPSFIVPSESPWPSRYCGLPLGYIVDRICNSVLFEMQVSEHKQELQRLGYTWNTLISKWTHQLLPALIDFHREHGHCDVPINYVVSFATESSLPGSNSVAPGHGFSLGKRVAALRLAGKGDPDVANILEDLDVIGFDFDLASSSFKARVLPALRAYKAKNGDCLVPQGFVVPIEKEEWPQATWGMKLGYIVRDMRARTHYADQIDAHFDELTALGFVWSTRQTSSPDSVATTAALNYWEVYKNIYDSDDVPSSFVVPADDPQWPIEAHYFRLGAWVDAYQRRLERADVSLHRPVRTRRSGVKLKNNTAYTTKTLNSRKSKSVTQKNNEIEDEDDVGDEIDGDDDDDDDNDDEDDLMAQLMATKTPSTAESESESVNAIPTLSRYQEEYWADVILASFRAYASAHGGSCVGMDRGFVVPREEPYPEGAWGMNVGLRLWHVQFGHRYALEVQKYEQELSELGITIRKSQVSHQGRRARKER